MVLIIQVNPNAKTETKKKIMVIVHSMERNEMKFLMMKNDDDEETCYKQIKQLIAQRSKEDSNRRKNTK